MSLRLPLLWLCLAASAHAAEPRFARSVHRYSLPRLTLTDQDGHKVRLADALPADHAVAVSFIFTTCSTICPVASATFAGLERRLGAAGKDVRLVSISIDPAHDRPATLRAYAKRFHAPPGWRFYTGDEGDIRGLLVAFEAYSGDKANHRSLTFLRRAGGDEWVRLEGFPSASDLAGEFHALLSAK
jgi:protein SCO1/2